MNTNNNSHKIISDIENLVFVQPGSWIYNQRINASGFAIMEEFLNEFTDTPMSTGRFINFKSVKFSNGDITFKIKLKQPVVILSLTVTDTPESKCVVSQTHWGKTTAYIEDDIRNINPFIDSRSHIFNGIREIIRQSAHESNIGGALKSYSVNDFNVGISTVAGRSNWDTESYLFGQDYFEYQTKVGVDENGVMSKKNYDKQRAPDGEVLSSFKPTPHFDSYNEAVNFSKYLKSDFCVFCLMVYKEGRHIVGGNIVGYIPMMSGYAHEWTDDRIYQHMGFDQEQVFYIQEMVNRWKKGKL
jgi:hypothetical protein